MADDTNAVDEAEQSEVDQTGGAFDITVYGVPQTSLSDREKEEVAQAVHRMLQENHDVHPDSVGVDGYMED